MGARLDEALGAVEARMAAVGVTAAGEDEPVVQTTFADPDAMVRSILSGFVPIEEAEAVEALIDHLGDALLQLIGESGSARAMKAGLRSTAAQVLAIGVALERTEDG